MVDSEDSCGTADQEFRRDERKNASTFNARMMKAERAGGEFQIMPYRVHKGRDSAYDRYEGDLIGHAGHRSGSGLCLPKNSIGFVIVELEFRR